jgi:hypothetical protein
MKRLSIAAAALTILGAWALAQPAAAADHQARVRVVHASPDAPAVDVWVADKPAFTNAPFKGITEYAALNAGSYGVKVVPAGKTEPAVIDAKLDLAAGKDYTVVAVGKLAEIGPLVLTDNNAAPAAGKAHVRFVHASPDAPAVDIAVAGGGPVLFNNVAFKGVGDYLPVDAGSYDLDVRVSGTETVALKVQGLGLEAGTVYTVFAMGLAGGEPALMAVPSVDAKAAAANHTMPASMPKTGAGGPARQSSWLLLSAVLGLSVLLGLSVRRQAVVARR